MKAIINLAVLVLTTNICFAVNADNKPQNNSNSDTLITKSEFSDRLFFTCDITGIDLDSFIFNTKTNKIIHPAVFNDEIRKEANTEFALKDITDEYLFLERVYEGTKHRTKGRVKEQLYILRYASKIGKQYAVRIKSKIFVNNKEFSGSDGRCDVTNRLF